MTIRYTSPFKPCLLRRFQTNFFPIGPIFRPMEYVQQELLARLGGNRHFRYFCLTDL